MNDLPQARCCISAVWDPRTDAFGDGITCINGCAYLFGGLNAPTVTVVATDEIIRYDANLNSYTQVGTLPHKRCCTSAVWDSNQNKAYIFFGWVPNYPFTNYNDGWRSDVLQFVPPTSTTLPEPLPSATIVLSSSNPGRGYTSAVFDPRPRDACPNGCAYIFGGRNFVKTDPAVPPDPINPINDKAVFEDVFRFNPNPPNLSPVTFTKNGIDRGKLPSARFGSAAVWDAVHHVAFVFGGGTSNYWQRDGCDVTNTVTGSVVVCEGADLDSHAVNEVLRFDPDQEWVTQLCGLLPRDVERATAVWDPTGATAYVFGGGHDVYPNYSNSNKILSWKATPMNNVEFKYQPQNLLIEKRGPDIEPLVSYLAAGDRPPYSALAPGVITVLWDEPTCDGGLPPRYLVERRGELKRGIIDWKLVKNLTGPFRVPSQNQLDLSSGLKPENDPDPNFRGKIFWEDHEASFDVLYQYKVTALNALNSVTSTQGSKTSQPVVGLQIFCPDGGIFYCSAEEWQIDSGEDEVLQTLATEVLLTL